MISHRHIMAATFGAGLLVSGAAHAQTANTPITASRTLSASDCTQPSESLSNGTSTNYTLTLPSSTATSPLTTGCRIRIVQNGTGTITVAQPSTGNTLGYYDFSTQTSATGSATLAGQYAGACITQEGTTLATLGPCE